MVNFFYLMLLVCPSPQEVIVHDAWGCYPSSEKDVHIRQSIVKRYQEFDYIECKEGAASNLIYKCKKKDVIAGCEFTLDDGTTLQSGLSCPRASYGE